MKQAMIMRLGAAAMFVIGTLGMLYGMFGLIYAGGWAMAYAEASGSPDNTIVVEWQVNEPAGVAGFNIRRYEVTEPYESLKSAAESSCSADASHPVINDTLLPVDVEESRHVYLDDTVQGNKTYCYQVEQVDQAGASAVHEAYVLSSAPPAFEWFGLVIILIGVASGFITAAASRLWRYSFYSE